MIRRTHACLASVVASLLVLAPAAARADALDAARAEAADRFDRALRLVDEGDLSGGLAEFQRAYALVPSPVVLYNVGLVYAALDRPVQAARALEQALAATGALAPGEAARAGGALREQREKIGQVAVSASVKEGVVEIDNVEAARLPLAGPLDVSAGPHVVGVVSPGYAPARREVLVAGRDRVDVRLDLVAIEGLLAHVGVHGAVPAADVFVDGERVGKTPLEATVTVAPGAHTVEVRRAGYVPATKSVTLGDGARADLALDPVVDRAALGREGGWLAIAASEPQAVLSVDGAEVGLVTGPVELPAGAHQIHVESGGFLPAERDVDVPLGGTKALSIVFEPTPETRVRYVSAAESRRAWSWVTIGAGAAVATGGVILALVEQGALPGARQALDQVNADWAYGKGGPCDLSRSVPPATEATCQARLNDATSRVDDAQTRRAIGWIGAGAGGAVLIAGAVLLLTGDSPHKYDERTAEPVSAGWQIAPKREAGGASVWVTRAF